MFSPFSPTIHHNTPRLCTNTVKRNIVLMVMFSFVITLHILSLSTVIAKNHAISSDDDFSLHVPAVLMKIIQTAIIKFVTLLFMDQGHWLDAD